MYDLVYVSFVRELLLLCLKYELKSFRLHMLSDYSLTSITKICQNFKINGKFGKTIVIITNSSYTREILDKSLASFSFMRFIVHIFTDYLSHTFLYQCARFVRWIFSRWPSKRARESGHDPPSSSFVWVCVCV